MKFKLPGDEASITGDGGDEIRLYADKDGYVTVPDDFQEVTSRLLNAGFVPVKEQPVKKKKES